MNRTDDISSLFSRFGASAGSYHEFESQIDYKEKSPVSEPQITTGPQAVPDTLAVAEAVEAPLNQPPLSTEPDSLALEPPLSEPEPEPVAEAEQILVHSVDAQPVPSDLVAEHALPIVPVARAAPVSNRLRHLLAEVVQVREAESQVLAQEVLRQEAARGRPAKCKAHVVVMVSLKGGVGKTTLAAGLASRLRLEGGRTLAIDLDPQNALHFQLGVECGEAGFASLNGAGQTLNDRLQPGFDGALLLPYGVLDDEEGRALINAMHEDRHWLGRQLDSMELGANDVVVIDTPTGSTASLAQALDVADEVVVVTTADAASFNTLDQIDRLLDAPLARAADSHRTYVVNQFDASREFSRDMLEVLKRRLGGQLMAVVSLDTTLGEALAYGRNPLSAAEPSAASEGVLLLAEQLKARFKASRAQGIEIQ